MRKVELPLAKGRRRDSKNLSLQEGASGVEESLNIYKNTYKRNRDTRNSRIFALDLNK